MGCWAMLACQSQELLELEGLREQGVLARQEEVEEEEVKGQEKAQLPEGLELGLVEVEQVEATSSEFSGKWYNEKRVSECMNGYIYLTETE